MKIVARAILSAGLIALALGIAARPALAAPSVVFTVNSTLDIVDDNPGDGLCHTDPLLMAAGKCTLRAAVMEADLASSTDGATIMVPSGIYSLTIPADMTDGANNGDLNLTIGNPIPISIVGAGAASTIIDANRNDRVLSIDLNRTAAISGLTLRGGSITNGAGGGIYNNGMLTVDHSTITGNQVVNNTAGGIFNSGTLTVTNSTIGSNSATIAGGGINNLETLTLDRSTIYGNSADNGGGIYNAFPDGNLVLVNSTLSSNMAAKDGGGLDNFATANVYNSTIVFNGADTEVSSSSAAGGVRSLGGHIFNMRNTLLAGNYHQNDFAAADCVGTLTVYGNNLISVLGDPAPCTIALGGGGAWTTLNSLNLLSPLQANGGPTLTHALLTGSNAIDAGDTVNGCIGPTAALATDQRGIPRVVGASCDIGAFEYLPPLVYLPVVTR